jgi:hypothetical protein
VCQASAETRRMPLSWCVQSFFSSSRRPPPGAAGRWCPFQRRRPTPQALCPAQGRLTASGRVRQGRAPVTIAGGGTASVPRRKPRGASPSSRTCPRRAAGLRDGGATSMLTYQREPGHATSRTPPRGQPHASRGPTQRTILCGPMSPLDTRGWGEPGRRDGARPLC